MDKKQSISENYPFQLTDNIWLLGNYFINLYLVKGKKDCALIEMGVSAMVGTVIEQLESLNLSPDYLVLTHPHTDHITGLPGLMKQYPEAHLVAGMGAREFANHPKALQNMIYEDQFITKRLQQKGIESGGTQFKFLPFPEDHHVIGRIEDIDLGGLNLTCIPVQGHSPGNISIFVPEEKALFVSDSLGFHYPGRGFCPLFLTGYTDFMETVKHMESLGPEIIAPGHQGVIINHDVENAFVESQAAANNMLEIVNNIRETDEKIAQMFFEKYYVDEFNLYSEENIMNCCRLLVRRSRETLREIIP